MHSPELVITGQFSFYILLIVFINSVKLNMENILLSRSHPSGRIIFYRLCFSINSSGCLIIQYLFIKCIYEE